eukprot:2331359-Pyramimonas_sp.AAC.1
MVHFIPCDRRGEVHGKQMVNKLPACALAPRARSRIHSRASPAAQRRSGSAPRVRRRSPDHPSGARARQL